MLFLLFLLASLYQGVFLLWVFPVAFRPDLTGPPSAASLRTREVPQPVSVIVCFRDEAERLASYLPLILEQEYPDFELIAVDDHSTDASAGVIAALQERFSNLRYLRPPHPTRPGKKDALTFGISQARHDILLLTDADCAPHAQNWIGHMTAPFIADPKLELVLGYSPYRAKASAVNRFQRFETTYTAFQYLGLTRRGRPYMGVGRNVAYRKAFFERAGGLESHAHLAGGDDDLLISHHAQSARTAIVIDPAAWTVSEPASDWQDYLSRKRRHVGVGIAYPLLPKLLIGGLAVSHLLHYGLAAHLIFAGFQSSWVIATVALRWLAVIWVYTWRSPQLNPKAAINSSSPERTWSDHLKLIGYDLGLVFYYLLTAPALLFGPGRGGWR